MERVTGIGGLFFRARDPAALAGWYADHLGIDPVPASYQQRPWWQQQGPTVFSPFPADSDAFGRPEQAWMLNLRVRDLDAMVAQLSAAGVEVTPDPQAYPNGRFAITADPEGNPIQLWEPTQDALQEPFDRHR
jgi:glyoxylase I family protein